MVAKQVKEAYRNQKSQYIDFIPYLNSINFHHVLNHLENL